MVGKNKIIFYLNNLSTSVPNVYKCAETLNIQSYFSTIFWTFSTNFEGYRNLFWPSINIKSKYKLDYPPSWCSVYYSCVNTKFKKWILFQMNFLICYQSNVGIKDNFFLNLMKTRKDVSVQKKYQERPWFSMFTIFSHFDL